jgi:PleD family two-component response regulator
MSVTSKSKNRSPDLPEPDGLTDAGSVPVTERIMDFRPRDRALSFVNMSLAAERADPFRVLIVDDDAAHRNLVSEILSAPLFSVSTAMSGAAMRSNC